MTPTSETPTPETPTPETPTSETPTPETPTPETPTPETPTPETPITTTTEISEETKRKLYKTENLSNQKNEVKHFQEALINAFRNNNAPYEVSEKLKDIIYNPEKYCPNSLNRNQIRAIQNTALNSQEFIDIAENYIIEKLDLGKETGAIVDIIKKIYINKIIPDSIKEIGKNNFLQTLLTSALTL